ncbi:RsiV family protein [Nocardia sp. CDC160]|uniref:RsiV family protein n=1 Tax=Nocardia sp. CDC160 TaxID=3112166 RepID=UPI002DBACF36|nr:RsiV family protein [Nocardia sp. CDC160]MEC3918915.1 RsiV family protein [Nocardia sp. CDC160]
MRVKSTAVLALCAVSFGLAACNAPKTPAGPTITPTAPTITPTAPAFSPTAPATTTTTAAATPVTAGSTVLTTPYPPNPGFVAITQEELKGTRGTLTYDLPVPGLGVASKAVNYEAARGFNDCMAMVADKYLTTYKDAQWVRDEGKNSRVERIGQHVLSGLLSVQIYSGGAHPFDKEATCVINADTSSLLTLKDVFADETKGLQLLSEQSAKLLPDTRAGAAFIKAGITPTPENFQAWTAIPEGMHVYFPQGQVAAQAAGSVDIVIPWTVLQAQLKPGMLAVLSS